MGDGEDRQVWIASADLESAQQRFDEAELNLSDAVVRAMDSGSVMADVAEAAGMTSEDVDHVMEGNDQPAA